ncbi:MAG: GPW/gp25 family protein [Chloroflexota bacterium]
MTQSPFRAWRFVHPDLDSGEGSGIPISAQGGIGMVAGAASVRQALLLLLSTAPGERVMRPEYGCHIHRLVFSPNDDTTAGLAIHYVRRAVQRWEPRVDILKIDAFRHEDTPDRLNILLDYRVRATRQVEQLAFGLNLA